VIDDRLRIGLAEIGGGAGDPIPVGGVAAPCNYAPPDPYYIVDVRKQRWRLI
jgi:hypothetical protein